LLDSDEGSLTMSTLREMPRKEPPTRGLAAVTDSRRRRVLSLLRDRSAPTTERDLATALAAALSEDASGDLPSDAVESAHARSRHAHLPKLDEDGLVSWDRADATVTESDHEYDDDARFAALLEAGDRADAVVDCVAEARRQTVLAVLESRSDPLTRTALAAAVATRDANGTPAADRVDAVRVELHHVHLPKLDDAGLVDYDPEDDEVTYRGPPDVPGGGLLVECYA
jgi:DNA-binding transcriptional ArsR family regulator